MSRSPRRRLHRSEILVYLTYFVNSVEVTLEAYNESFYDKKSTLSIPICSPLDIGIEIGPENWIPHQQLCQEKTIKGKRNKKDQTGQEPPPPAKKRLNVARKYFVIFS